MRNQLVKMEVVGLLVLSSVMAWGQGRDNFLRQQALAEMQRVSGQIDVLQNNFDDLARRVSRLESGGGESRQLRQEIDSLRATVSELRRQLESQRGEIVRDISGRIAKMQPPPAPAPQKQTVRRTVVSQPHYEYTVQNGDSLFLVAKAFNTSASRIREMNNLKSDHLRVGQKLKVPKDK